MDVTNRLLAYQISTQIPAHDIPPFMNATINPLLLPPSLSPSSSARWINALFFFSLVLSLAAALFGIMAKQWVREYMKWNAPLAAPRENVLVRQIRFEAWESWNVEAIMWSIPFLLEVAMILFLLGTVALLWTLDSVVAASATASVAAFLILVSTFTTLPIMVKHCPYKAPPSWVLLRIMESLGSWIFPRRWRHTQTWRGRDLASSEFAEDDLSRLDRVFQEKHTILDHDGGAVSNATAQEQHSNYHQDILPEFTRDVIEVPILLRALLWISQASQDPRLCRYFDQCMADLRPSRNVHAHTLTDWCMLSTLRRDSNLTLPPISAILSSITDESAMLPRTGSRLSASELRKVIGITINTGLELPYDESSGELVEATISYDATTERIFSDYSSPSNPLFFRVLATTLTTVTEPWTRTGFDPTEGPNPDSGIDLTMLLKVFEMVVLMTDIASSSTDVTFLRNERHMQGLLSILDDNPKLQKFLHARAPGLCFWAFALVLKFDNVKMGPYTGLSGMCIIPSLQLAILISPTKVPYGQPY